MTFFSKRVTARLLRTGTRQFGSSYPSAFASLSKVRLSPWSAELPSAVRVTLSDAKKRNAMGSEMLSELKEVFSSDIWQSDDTRVLVVEGDGAVFSAGHDLKEILALQKRESEFRALFDLCSQLMEAIPKCPVPVIAKCHGHAAAAGLQLAAACDLTVAHTQCQFSTPGISFGLFCATPGVELSRVMPRKAAMELLLTGRMMGAERARQMGLVNSVGDTKEEVNALVEELIRDIVAKSKPAVALGKLGFYKQIAQTDLKEAHKTAGECMLANAKLNDFVEGISSFAEKRKPEWTHS